MKAVITLRQHGLGISILAGLFALCCLFILEVRHAHAAEWWLGGAIGADYNNFDPMETLSFEGGLWPDNKKWGFQYYLEFADPSCDDEMWTVGTEPLWRFKKLYGGVGLALSDERLCDRAGTKWNFSIVLGMRVTKHFDVQWRHRSHGDDLGIRTNTPNEGVNLIQLRWRP
ncbi:MAG: hypothetical protein ACE5NW_03980 [Acidiferrobacterales bacterium]